MVRDSRGPGGHGCFGHGPVDHPLWIRGRIDRICGRDGIGWPRFGGFRYDRFGCGDCGRCLDAVHRRGWCADRGQRRQGGDRSGSRPLNRSDAAHHNWGGLPSGRWRRRNRLHHPNSCRGRGGTRRALHVPRRFRIKVHGGPGWTERGFCGFRIDGGGSSGVRFCACDLQRSAFVDIGGFDHPPCRLTVGGGGGEHPSLGEADVGAGLRRLICGRVQPLHPWHPWRPGARPRCRRWCVRRDSIARRDIQDRQSAGGSGQEG